MVTRGEPLTGRVRAGVSSWSFGHWGTHLATHNFISTADKRAEMRSRYFTRAEAGRLGWNVEHPRQGGQFLEEHEVVDFFPSLGGVLGRDRPDFAALDQSGKPRLIIECKADASHLDRALEQAAEYAEAISRAPGFDVRMAVGVAGTPDKRVYTKTWFRIDRKWGTLESHGFPLTQLPTPFETDLAIERGDSTTDVQLPDEREFFDAAINISNVFRLAKIEESKRPVVIGAIILAMWQGEFLLAPRTVLKSINTNVDEAISQFVDLTQEGRDQLAETLRLGTESNGLKDRMEVVVSQLERLNVRSIMRSGVDFLGQFYETFLRYGCDTKKMGIVFTPRHITRFCADLIRVEPTHKVYDPACGTGGFLVAAFDRMMRDAGTERARRQVRRSMFGRDTNATVWALAMLNMFFRGDGKSNIVFKSAFAAPLPAARFDRALLNPPFSQEGEPEIDFIDHALTSLKPGGIAAIVVKTTIMVDPDLSEWRRNLVANHQVLGVISLPPDLFYPTAAPTVILVVRAHAPNLNMGAFIAVIRNDGYEISKKRRIGRDGSQLADALVLFHRHLDGHAIEVVPGFAGSIDRRNFKDGQEVCAERWLPSAPFGLADYKIYKNLAFRQIAMAVANYPDAVDATINDFEEQLALGAERSTKQGILSKWFAINNGSSSGLTNYPGGEVPYISSGDTYNSIAGMVQAPEEEIYTSPRLTVTAFGQAAVQPWTFAARGNGGSAVRVLGPKCAMSLAELLWFTGQINAQRWRFHYGRMATKGRLEQLRIEAPPADLAPVGALAARVKRFRGGVAQLTGEVDIDISFNRLMADWKASRGFSSSARDMCSHPSYLRIIGMGERAVPLILSELRRQPDHWFGALHAITGENPIPDHARGRLDKMAASWVQWGEQNGYI